MGLFDIFRRGAAAEAARPRAAIGEGGTLIVGPQQLEEALRHGNMSAAGTAVTPERAMRAAAVFACVRLRCTGPANLPLDIKRRIDERTRADASDHWAYPLLRRRPNNWQKPHQFKRQLQANVMLRGNAYALKVPGVGGRVQALLPLHPDRVKTQQLDDLSIVHDWTRKNGSTVRLGQEEVFHLYGLTLNGYSGVTPLTYARESIGTSLAMSEYAGRVLAKGARVSGALKTENKLTDKAWERLKESVEDFRSGGEREAEFMILEEGLSYEKMSLSLSDMQWIEALKLGWTEIGMFYGVPPHMIGNTEKSTSWGSGIEEQRQGFLDFSAEDDLTMWEEAINGDLIGDREPAIYARFNRSAFVRGNLKSRYGAYQIGRNGGWLSKNDIRGLEDMNPIPGGDDYDAPLNSNAAPASKDDDDDETPPPGER
ncbi:MAG TPA: phage portal protein [Allosphingosinicella sp.]|jgi:HK97 family phage portal protein